MTSEISPPKISALLSELIVAAELVLTRGDYSSMRPGALDRLRLRFEEEWRSPRVVGIGDEKATVLLDVLDLIELKRRMLGPRAADLWLQVAGVLLPQVRADLAHAILTEKGR